MENNQLAFLKLLTMGIGNESALSSDISVLSDETRHFTEMHQCIPFVYRACVAMNMYAPEIWKQKTIYSAINNTQKLIVQSKICKILSDSGISYAIFKGSAVAVHYPIPDLRSLGDIDILVRDEDYEKTIKLFIGEIDEKDAWHNFHFTFSMDSVEIEIHKYVTHIPKTEADRKIYNLMSDCLDDVLYLEYDGHRFPALKNKYHVVALLLHKKRHFLKNNITLRMVCDWAFFVKSVDLVEWNNEIYPFIKECGLDAFADAFTLVSDKYLGFDNVSKLHHKISDETLESLMDILLASDPNIKNNDISSGIGVVYSNYINSDCYIVRMVKTFNSIIRSRHPLAKNKLLLPFFWIYVPLKYVCKLIIGKRKRIQFKLLDALAKKRAKVYEELKIKQ